MSIHALRRVGPHLALTLALTGLLSGCDIPGSDQPQNRQQAYRFLNQATFGSSEDEINNVGVVGYNQWITDQLARKSEISFTDYLEARKAELGSTTAQQRDDFIYEAFYGRALTSKAQLRNRVLFALSEMFVTNIDKERPEYIAAYLDVLDKGLDGTYRDLLEAITKSPSMGFFLTYLGNKKEDPVLSTQPDENYAREIMQLFSIGLYQLNLDGTLKLDANGQAIESYTADDVKGLSKVFTGWTRNPGTSTVTDRKVCFVALESCYSPSSAYLPMVDFPEYHSTSEKTFLGVTIPASNTPDAQGDLTIALNTLANHPNTAPFFSRQLIQRLVTSNPSPAYVKRVATRFLATGGSIAETVKAVLLDSEARNILAPSVGTFGKVREPVLRMTAVLRAFKFTDPHLATDGTQRNSQGGQSYATIGQTTDPNSSLSQTPFAAPSVFNFFRPGYVMPRSVTAQNGLVAPEMQLVSESTNTSYANFMTTLVTSGVSSTSWTGTTLTGPKLDLSEQRAAAEDDNALIAQVADRLLGGQISSTLTQNILNVLKTMTVPASDGTPASVAARNTVLDQRTKAAILLVSVSPEFLVQR